MATDMKRKNVYLDDDTAEKLRQYAHDERLSESEVCREALQLFLNLDPVEYNAAIAFAQKNGVEVGGVFSQMAHKLIPREHYQ